MFKRILLCTIFACGLSFAMEQDTAKKELIEKEHSHTKNRGCFNQLSLIVGSLFESTGQQYVIRYSHHSYRPRQSSRAPKNFNQKHQNKE